MSERSACPDPARLKGILHGTLSDLEQEELIGHLDGCAECRRRLDDLATGDGSVTEITRRLAYQITVGRDRHGPRRRSRDGD
jgi:hypothetical protein